jgi:REP-associated tyrosine transposase
MAQSLASIMIHLVFSTKDRRPLIQPDIEDELHAYAATVCKNSDCHPHIFGGTTDHMHIALSLGREVSVSDITQQIKQASSRWLKTKGHQYGSFAWQSGYGAFSFGQSQLDDVRNYVANQKEHHLRISFKDEFRRLLERYQIEYDERYVWG